jgi:glycosyltransferase involved in cell wall biosynthesis
VDYLFIGDLPTSSYVPGRFKELEFAIQLARLIRRDPTRYSVVNIHAPAGCAYGVLRYFSSRLRKNGPAYVMTLHGLEERRIHIMKREAKKGKAFHFSFKNRLWHRIYHLSRFYFSIKTADHALCICREAWTLAQLKYDLDPDQVTYSPSGVEERFFIQREYSRTVSTRLLLAGTWLDDQRGIFYIRDALRNLATRLPELRLTLAGCGTHGEAIMNFFDPELRPMIEILSVVPSGQMPCLFAQYDIFVWPSLMEGISLVVQEAMASGIAVVTTETCGMIDSVENDFNGLLIPPADSVALENAIWRLSQDPELRARLGKAAQETIRRRFTWARTIDSTEHACASALRRVGRESEIQTEPPTRAPKAAAVEHF